MQNSDALITRLDILLDAERDVLLTGNVTDMAEIAREKEEILEQLSALDESYLEGLTPLNDKIRRNHVLLDQALNGIRRVSKKLSEIRTMRKAFDTYDQKGRKMTISSKNTNSFEKRA